MSGPLSVPGAKVSLLLSTLLSVLGIGGLLGSVGLLTYQPGAPTDGMFASEASQAVTELMVGSTLMRGLAAANLLVSVLLIVASFVLMLRRPSALWWIRQALVGNVLYTVSALAGGVVFHRQHAETLQRITEQLPQMQDAPPGTPMPPAWASFAIGDACRGLVVLGFYFLIWRLSRRPDVRAFVRAEKPERPE